MTSEVTDNTVGRLRLYVENRAGRAIATSQDYQGALRVLRPHYLDDSAQVTYTIVNPGGGYLGGDRYDIRVEVAEDASVLLTTQSATKVYRTPEIEAYQRAAFRVGPRAVLEHLPDQLIAYRQAHYVQDTVVEMDPSATFVSTEIITPGWSPDGAVFKYHEVRLRQEVRIDGRPAVVDNLIVRPGHGDRPVDSALFTAGRTHVGTLLAVDRRVDDDLVADMRERVDAALAGGPGSSGVDAEQRDRPAPVAGLSRVEGPGLAMRVLGMSTEEVTAALRTVVDELRARWRGQGAVRLRKY